MAISSLRRRKTESKANDRLERCFRESKKNGERREERRGRKMEEE